MKSEGMSTGQQNWNLMEIFLNRNVEILIPMKKQYHFCFSNWGYFSRNVLEPDNNDKLISKKELKNASF